MRLILDEHELSDVPTDLAGALDRARIEAENDGRVVVDVFMDDMRLAENEIVEAAHADLSAVTLRCVTADPRELVTEALEAAADAIDQLESAHTDIADLIQTGDTPQALEMLGEVLGMWNQIGTGVVQGAALVGLDLDRFRADDAATGSAIESLTTQLQSIQSSAMVDDWVGVSDCLGYEMKPVTDAWRDMLGRLTAHVKTMPKPDPGSASSEG